MTQESSPTSGAGLIAILIILCTAANIGANWWISQMPTAQTGSPAETLRQIQYDQAGGKDIYDLYMKLQKLQAGGQKAKLEDQIKALESGNP